MINPGRKVRHVDPLFLRKIVNVSRILWTCLFVVHDRGLPLRSLKYLNPQSWRSEVLWLDEKRRLVARVGKSCMCSGAAIRDSRALLVGRLPGWHFDVSIKEGGQGMLRAAAVEAALYLADSTKSGQHPVTRCRSRKKAICQGL
jgi:hypothetical protein